MNTKIDDNLVKEIVYNVRIGVRTKQDLIRCGCGSCRKALSILNKKIPSVIPIHSMVGC